MSNENEIKLVQVSHLEDDNEVLYDLVYNSVEDKIYLVNATTEGEISLDDLPTDVDLGTWEGLIEIVALAQAKLNSAVNAHKGNNTETRIVKRYVRTVWQDNVTALDAENMNNIENGIYFAHERLNTIDKAFDGEKGVFYKDINLNGNALGYVGTATISNLKVKEIQSNSEDGNIKIKSPVTMEKELIVNGDTTLQDVNVDGSLIVSGNFNGYGTIGVGAIDSFDPKYPDAENISEGKPDTVYIKKDIEFDINDDSVVTDDTNPSTRSSGKIKNVYSIESNGIIHSTEGDYKSKLRGSSITFYDTERDNNGVETDVIKTIISGKHEQNGTYTVNNHSGQDWVIYSSKVGGTEGQFGVDTNGNIYTVGNIKTPNITVNTSGVNVTGGITASSVIYTKGTIKNDITSLDDSGISTTGNITANGEILAPNITELSANVNNLISGGIIAAKATSDSDGNKITATYETKNDASSKLSEAKNHAVQAAAQAAANVKNDLLNGAGEAYDTLKELSELINDNTDAIDALETIASKKADANHTHNSLVTKQSTSKSITISYGTEKEMDELLNPQQGDIFFVIK